MKLTLLVCCVMLLWAAGADARKYVGTTGDAPATVGLVRWRDGLLRARYRCRGEAAQCPSLRKGKLLAEMQHAGDFYGTLTFRGGTPTCRVVGSLTSLDGVLWETGEPKDAPRILMSLGCSPDGEPTHSFTGQQP